MHWKKSQFIRPIYYILVILTGLAYQECLLIQWYLIFIGCQTPFVRSESDENGEVWKLHDMMRCSTVTSQSACFHSNSSYVVMWVKQNSDKGFVATNPSLTCSSVLCFWYSQPLDSSYQTFHCWFRHLFCLRPLYTEWPSPSSPTETSRLLQIKLQDISFFQNNRPAMFSVPCRCLPLPQVSVCCLFKLWSVN